MLNLPILKFEKSCNYLDEQLTIQTNNKQLVLDIISNIGLILNNSSEETENQYSDILEDANEFLNTVSNNITSIEQLNLELSNITKELTTVLADQKKNTKTKAYYIAAFSNIKNNITIYSKKFQNMEEKLSLDNTNFNEFINKNNFKYNFVSKDDSTNTFTFTGFSVNDEKELSVDASLSTPSNEINNNENDLINNIDNSLVDMLLEEELSNDLESSLLEQIESLDDIKTEETVLDNNFSEEIENLDDSLLEALLEEELSNPEATLEEITIPEENSSESSTTQDNTVDETQEVESIFEEFDETGDFDSEILDALLEEELTTTSSTSEELFEKSNTNEQNEKINDLTNEFKEILMSLSNPDINTENTSDAVISLFKEILPNVPLDKLVKSEEITDSEDDSIFEDDNEEYENFVDLKHTFAIESHIVNNLKNTTDLNYFDFEYDETKDSIEESTLSFEDDIYNEYSSFKPSSNFDYQNFDKNYDLNIANENKKVEIEFLYNELTKDSDDLFEEPTISPIASSFEEITNSNPEIDLDIDTTTTIEDIDDINIEDDAFLADILAVEDSSSDIDNDILNDIDFNDSENEELLELLEKSIEEKDITNSEESTLPEISDITKTDSNQTETIEPEETLDVEDNNIEEYDAETDKSSHLSKTSFAQKLYKIQNAVEDNKTLLISERLQKIYLPYKISELKTYMTSYPDSYESLQDVVEQEFILPFDYFKKHPSKSRFTETYNLLKNREGRNFMKSVSYAFRLLKKNNLNPAIIASCKTQHELDSYLYYLESNNLKLFKFFNVIYEVNPM